MSRFRRLLALSFLIATACGGSDDGSGPSGPSALSKQAGDGQTATVGQAVGVAPSVKVTDASNQPVSGVSVTFSVASGGGSVTGATAATDAGGIATVGSWTLGTTSGANTLVATAAGTGINGNPATFTATANAGAPRTLTKEAGDNQTASPGAAVATAPAVKVVDQFGNNVSGVTVTFAIASGGGTVTGATPATGADGRAAVGSWQLGLAAGANTLTASVAGTGITGNPATFTATAQTAAFNPTQSATLGGTNSYSSVNIPAGVTITASSDLVINATGNVTIAGTITGDCRAISVSATGTLSITGTIRNNCTTLPAGVAPALSLVGRGGYNLGGTGTVVSSGSVEITNDPTLTDADFLRLASGRDLSTAGARIVSGVATAIANQGTPTCVVVGRSFTADPPTAKAGTPGGTSGGKGDDGSTWTLKCRGEMQMSNTSVTGQNGGPGGQGQDPNNANGASATGGGGGDGGKLRVLATIGLDLGGNNTFTSGSGGAGGSATASGGPNPTPATAASATATGGKGGNSGLIEVIGKAGITIGGGLTMAVGSGGAGGAATAIGADGMDATSAKAAQHGGTGTATGGAGGTSPNKVLSSSGSVAGLGNVTVSGGNGGAGGASTSAAGKGGGGVAENKPGGNGGAIASTAGKGGDANLRNQNNALVGTGGIGGNMILRGGNGGLGYNDCQTPVTSGGRGGNGGTGSGNSGLGGNGATNGAPGTILVENAGNGARGGDGLGPGAGGTKGASAGIGANGPRTDVNPIFTDGQPGNPCPGTHTNKTALVNDPVSDTHGHEQFIAQVGSRPTSVTFGTTNSVSISGLLNNSTIVLSGTRTGNNLSMNGTGVINIGGGQTRNASVSFSGTVSATGIVGQLSVTIAGFPQPTVYPVAIVF